MIESLLYDIEEVDKIFFKFFCYWINDYVLYIYEYLEVRKVKLVRKKNVEIS